MHWITTLTFPLHTSALNTFALSVTVALPYFFPIYASVSCAVLNINSLHFSSTCFDNLPCVLRLMSSAFDKSGEICSMVATKNRGRSIFYYLSITPSTYNVRRRTNDSAVGPLGKSYCWSGRITIERNVFCQISSEIPPSNWVPSLLHMVFPPNTVAIIQSTPMIS